jgi:hypothetical protein
LLKSTDPKSKEGKEETILKARFKPPTTQKMIENRQMQEKIRIIKKDLENQLKMPAHQQIVEANYGGASQIKSKKSQADKQS